MGLGTGALAGAGIGAAAYGAYSWGKDAVTAQEERSEIVQRARLGGWITTFCNR
jgi:nicotinamide riboside transporter PnuC